MKMLDSFNWRLAVRISFVAFICNFIWIAVMYICNLEKTGMCFFLLLIPPAVYGISAGIRTKKQKSEEACFYSAHPYIVRKVSKESIYQICKDGKKYKKLGRRIKKEELK